METMQITRCCLVIYSSSVNVIFLDLTYSKIVQFCLLNVSLTCPFNHSTLEIFPNFLHIVKISRKIVGSQI